MTVVDRKLLGDTLLTVLEDADVDLRARMPDVFEHVDRIKATPDWIPHRFDLVVGGTGTFVLRECARCGDPFIGETARSTCCSLRCAGEQRAFIRRRRLAAAMQ